MIQKQEIAAFARIGARPIPRVARMMGVAEELGMTPLFFGALRDENMPREDEWEGWQVHRLGNAFPLLNGKRPFLYIKSVLSYNWHLFGQLRKISPKIVHASDIETMPAASLYRVFRRCRLIYNIHDNLAQRYSIPAALAWLLNTIEGVAVRIADVALVPESFRRTSLPKWSQSKVVVVRNTPSDTDYAEPQFDDSSNIRIFFGGWLDYGRGLRSLIRMAEENEDVDLRIAGEGAPEIVEELRNNSSLEYLGFLDHAAVLAETRRCHFVPALYDPSRVINRYAASNKLAEALAIGRLVIVNCEMKIAQSLAPNQCLIVSAYNAAETTVPRLRELVRDRAAYRQASQEARRIYDQYYSWEKVKNTIREVYAAESPDST